ncbi:hypothetical protein [Oceanobacillus jeddahense]|uniref:hypothetical protein n=1 Tax=Oceanobacillus jeddahense TaxID=1462527 RepID=UPI000595DEF5|nr:hypothetical protein [Oceanobacillus jeddahense]
MERVNNLLKITHVQQPINNSIKTVTDKNIPDNNKSNTPAATVTISDQSQNKYIQSLKLNKTNQDDILGMQFKKFYEEYNSAEAIEQRRLDQLEKEQSYNRLEDEFNLKAVQYDFPENTRQHTIKGALEGKVVNASIYAAELGSAIRSSISMPDKSAEERAAYREMALKQAEYITEHYFDDEQEAKSFMDEINRYYENDVLREKGYVAIDNSGIEPFKKYSSPISNNNEVSFYTLAKNYMEEDDLEQFINGKGAPAESAKFLDQLQMNKEKYSEAIRNEFKLNEQQMEERIAGTKSMLETFAWENGRVAETMAEQPDYLAEILKWNESMLNLIN